MANKAVLTQYYLPAANHAEDALAFVKKWSKYQRFNNIPLKPQAKLTILTKPCPFAQLGIDIVASTKW